MPKINKIFHFFKITFNLFSVCNMRQALHEFSRDTYIHIDLSNFIAVTMKPYEQRINYSNLQIFVFYGEPCKRPNYFQCELKHTENICIS